MRSMIIWLYGLVLLALGVYSYLLIDPNITFIQHPLWVQFRDWAVYLGYYRRDISWNVYITLLIILFIFHYLLTKKYKHNSVLTIATLIAGIGCISYPFLSHDLFNYLFDARILTYYGKNPYMFTALDFQGDLWTRFMHWTHRTYPYGPTFLPLTLIPSFLGLGKFSLNFVLYKLMNSVLYFFAVYFLYKKNKRGAMFFATHPIVIIEGLVNAHNDMIAVSIGMIGIYLLEKKYSIWSRVVLLVSAGIKYATAPLLIFFVSMRHSRESGNPVYGFTFLKSNLSLDTRLRGYDSPLLIAFVAQICVVVYLCYKMEIQPWYFLSLFAFVPFFGVYVERLSVLFFGLLLSYYPFIRFGDWTAKTVGMKREIILIMAILQAIYLIYLFIINQFKLKKR